MRVKELTAFIKERESIRVKKEAGKPQPWTKDHILATYRFCNIRREDDRVTRWVASEVRQPFADHADLWFILVVARLLNQPESIHAVLPALVKWNPNTFSRTLSARKAQGKRNFNAAYIVSTNGQSMDKVEYLTRFVLQPMWEERKFLRPTVNDTLTTYHAKLMEFDGMGSFMAAQVVADLKYTAPLNTAADWHTWAASGPGSRRGLNRVLDQPVGQPWKEEQWLGWLQTLQGDVNSKSFLNLHAQDLQNCLCEFDKYERVRLGEGRPKQIYKER